MVKFCFRYKEGCITLWHSQEATVDTINMSYPHLRRRCRRRPGCHFVGMVAKYDSLWYVAAPSKEEAARAAAIRLAAPWEAEKAGVYDKLMHLLKYNTSKLS